jgi:hypothetical protein
MLRVVQFNLEFIDNLIVGLANYEILARWES